MKKKSKRDDTDEMLPHYDFSGGVRGKYAERYKQGVKTNVTSSPEKASTVSSRRLSGRSIGGIIVHGKSPSTNITTGEKMARNEKTSKAIGTKASKLLKNKTSSKTVKSVAGSAPTQRPDKKKKK